MVVVTSHRCQRVNTGDSYRFYFGTYMRWAFSKVISFTHGDMVMLGVYVHVGVHRAGGRQSIRVCMSTLSDYSPHVRILNQTWR